LKSRSELRCAALLRICLFRFQNLMPSMRRECRCNHRLRFSGVSICRGSITRRRIRSVHNRIALGKWKMALRCWSLQRRSEKSRLFSSTWQDECHAGHVRPVPNMVIYMSRTNEKSFKQRKSVQQKESAEPWHHLRRGRSTFIIGLCNW
jgi:hypothetical protein